MKKREYIAVFQNIISEIEKNISELLEFWNIYDQQIFFITAISIYDKWFLDYHSEKLSTEDFSYRIIEYGYPVFIRRFYSSEFCHLPGIAHKAVDEQRLKLYSKLLYSCGILGWMQSFIDNINAGFYSCSRLFNIIRVKFVDRYHWNEYIEKQYAEWYASFVSRFQSDEYEKLNLELPEVLKKLEKGVFVWKDAFMGYTHDLDTEKFFRQHALLDAQQSTEWDLFPDDVKFGDLYYGDIVEAIVDFSGYSIKHIYFARTLQQKHPELIIENLLQNIAEESVLIKLISENRTISVTQAQNILRLLALTPETVVYYTNLYAHSAPLIKVSQTQYVRSVSGFLSAPFRFMLFNLRIQYAKEWDKNTKSREEVFRNQLYTIFSSEKNKCISHPIVLQKGGKTITDIDATIVDQNTGEIGLFQLKWQDPSDYSPFALRSKRNNYRSKTEMWVNAVQHWINESTEKEIAAKLGISAKYVKKDNIFLFVLGRDHGNYSSSQAPSQNCCWGQWYQILLLAKELQQKNILTLSKLYSFVCQTNPYKQKIIEPANIFSYGKYRIIMGGNAKGIISELLSKVKILHRKHPNKR